MESCKDLVRGLKEKHGAHMDMIKSGKPLKTADGDKQTTRVRQTSAAGDNNIRGLSKKLAGRKRANTMVREAKITEDEKARKSMDQVVFEEEG